MAFVELHDICKTYQLGEVSMPVLQGITLDIDCGEYVALMGSSGSGKTTLMNILGCLDRPTSGRYILDGRDASALSTNERAALRSLKMGFVFQNFNLLPRTTAVDNVRMPLSYAPNAPSEREGRERAEEMLRRVGLGDRLDHEPSQLSGGQQQRVAIARALINRPPILFADEPTGNLDSTTSEEVMRIFAELNREGVTIVLVTHDDDVARHAGRIIRIRDGVIEAEANGGAPTTQRGGAEDQQMTGGALTLRGALEQPQGEIGGGAPRMGSLMSTALGGLRRNKMRAALTTLGIVIGISAVIAMMEIGHGSSQAIQKSISSMGANNLIILPGAAASGGISFGAGSVMTLTPQDVDAIRDSATAVRAVAPLVRARTQIIYGNRNWSPNDINGTTPSYLDVRDWSVAEGDLFTDQDVRTGAKVCLVGKTVVRELFQGESSIGKEVRLNNVPLRVIGVLSEKGANMMGMDQDDVLIAPWTTIKYRVAGTSLANATQSYSSASSTTQTNTTSQLYPSGGGGLYPAQSATQAMNTPMPVRFINVDRIMAAATSTDEIPEAIRQIKEILREKHRIAAGEPDDFDIRNLTEMTNTLSSTANVMTRLLLAVAMISLLVGGVGIMNIMLVSVTERTREIGLRMAVGARQRNILQQFLAESVVLCFLGGFAGILLGRGASVLVSSLLHWPTEASAGAIMAAFAVSASVGIVFGYYPAWKASRLDPIIALRYE